MSVLSTLRTSAAVAVSVLAFTGASATPPEGLAGQEPPTIDLAHEACIADADGDGKLGILDFVEFHDLFAAGNPKADINNDGVLDLLDFVAFHDAFVEGCDQGFAWTDLQPSIDSRLVHVSTGGNDDNDGTIDAPVRTIKHACTLLRDGYPDWLLLKRGDVWVDEDFGRWKKSGRSNAEPIVIGAYGEGAVRPLVQTGLATRAIWLDGVAGLEHIAIVGIELFAHTYEGGEGAEAGVLWLGGNGDLLIEDCLIRGYKDNIVINGFGDIASNLRIRGSVIVDAYSTVGHAQGVYAQEAENIQIEGCVFDHNGWLAGLEGAEATVFNHNIYIQSNCNGVDVRDCMLLDASSHAIQLRCSGTVEGCVFLSNPIGLLVGNGGEAPPATTLVADNVFLFADDVSAETPRGLGIDLLNIESGLITGNVLAQSKSIHENGHAMKMHGSATSPVNGVEFTGNIVHQWPGGIRFNATDINDAVISANVIHIQSTEVPLIKHSGSLDEIGVDYTENRYFSEAAPHIWYQIGFEAFGFEEWKSLADEHDALVFPASFADPYRTPESYQHHLGEDDTWQAFVGALRQQGRRTWDSRYSTNAILAYFQAGYAPAP